MDILAGLNEQQYAAVTAPDGPVIILAGPGSGKTRVLTNRIAYLIQHENVAPWRIMAVTFTNKAAKEMRERIEAILGEDLHGLSVGTFHATCARILRREAENLAGYTRDFVIFDTDDQKAAVKQAMADLNIDDKRFNPAKIRNGISAAKNMLIGPLDYQATDYIGEIIGRVYRRYQEILVTNNAMDFDDLLMNTAFLFQQAPLVTARYREQYQHVLIDEFQDTNLTQYSLIRRLVGDDGNIFIVGDSDQSIYKWRGADIRNLQRFRQDYPHAVEILLEQNYRSTQIILDAAKEVIKQNQNRTHKELFTKRQGGNLVIIEEAYSDLDEASKVLDEIERLLNRDGYKGGDIAIMYRTNAQSRVLEEAFIRKGMPYQLVGATRFYGRREIKDVIAYLRVLHNPADEFSLARIINVPKRSIGGKTWETLREWASNQGLQPAEALIELATRPGIRHPFSGRQYSSLYEFGQQLYNWQGLSQHLTVAQLLDKILEEIDYKGYLDDGTEQGLERWGNVIEFRNVALLADDLSLAEFLEEVSLVSEVDNLEEGEKAPTLLTLHAAKGLEFPVVFLVGLEDGILPHSRSISSDDREEMAEERRLFYVGITRAKDRVYMYHAFQRMNWGRQETAVPSRFLNDIPLELVKGGSAGHRRAQTKQRMSSWHWDADDDDDGDTNARGYQRGGGRNRHSTGRSFDDEDAFRPKTRRTTTSVPGYSRINQNLPTPNSERFEYEEARPSVAGELQFKTGDKVSHAKFGSGIVVESRSTGADEEVTVAFTDHGIKRLAASIARLEKVG